MHATPRWLATIGLAALATTGCICNADEVRAVTVSAGDSLTVVRGGATRKVEIVTRLTEQFASAESFEYVYDVVEGTTAGDGVRLTLSGTDPVTDEVVLLVLALPASLRRGEVYPVGATFTVQAGIPSDPRLWGPYDLRQPAVAEAAFTVAAYSFPPGVYVERVRAVSSSGTVRVTDRSRGWAQLSLDLRLTDASGAVTAVTGSVQVTSESSAPPCT